MDLLQTDSGGGRDGKGKERERERFVGDINIWYRVVIVVNYHASHLQQ